MFAPLGRLGNEKLTTLKNLNFDSPYRRNVQWFSPISLFLPPSLATWSGFSGHKIPAVFSLIASPKLFPVSSYLVLRSVTHLYSLNSFQCWLSDLKGAHLSSIRTKSQVVTPILTRISAATFKERVRFGRTCAVLRRGGQNDRRRASLGR